MTRQDHHPEIGEEHRARPKRVVLTIAPRTLDCLRQRHGNGTRT
jgi:hypothetical protein